MIFIASKNMNINFTVSRCIFSYELGVNGKEKLMETGILLIKMNIAHFTLVNMEILKV